MIEKTSSNTKGFLVTTLTAFALYTALSAKEYTWIFVSGDSGDWLASSLMWFAPQPYGSPLYVFLCKGLAQLPGDLVVKETILLSCLPSALTVGLVYLIVSKLAGSKVASLSSIILVGSAVFLTQSTILEQYALTTMLITLAFYFYLHKRRKLCLASLGLATSVHIFALPITLLWLIVERTEWRGWLKVVWVYVLFGIIPYIYIPILMYLHAPPLIAGWLDWGEMESLKYYLFEISNTLIGQLSVFDFPLRLTVFAGLLLTSFGLAWIPIALGISQPIDKPIWIIVVTIGVSFWYYFFNLDPSTWTFLIFSSPFLATLAGIGITKMRLKHISIVMTGTLILIILNSFLLNAHLLTKENNLAMEAKAEIEALPENSAVVSLHGPYILCLFYVMAEGRDDLMPVFFSNVYQDYEEKKLTSWYVDYCSWVYEEYGVCSFNPTEMAKEALEKGRELYIIGHPWRLDKGTGKTPWSNFCLNEIQYVEGKSTGDVRKIAHVVPKEIVISGKEN